MLRRPNPLLPFGVIYLSGARHPDLDALAGWNLENADTAREDMPLGILIQPGTQYYCITGPDSYRWVGIDNGCYAPKARAKFKLDRYLRIINRVLDSFGEDAVLFATAPDMPGDWALTLEKSLPTLPILRAQGVPAALCIQDGATVDTVPWDEIDCVFLAGSTEFKLSETMREISQAALRRGKWVHMGRVNSILRLEIARGFGCRSADGTYLVSEMMKGPVRGAAAVETMHGWARTMWQEDEARAAFRQSGLF